MEVIHFQKFLMGIEVYLINKFQSGSDDHKTMWGHDMNHLKPSRGFYY